jgi:DNA primase
MTVVDDIKGRLDILEVVAQHVTLNRAGSSYRANCPFHQERTPSFYVFPDRQTWRCFGACTDGGDLFSFVMRAENLDFAEALKRLAQQAGVALPSRERRSQQQGGFQINEVARKYYQEVLASNQGAEARAYLDRRGLSAQSIDTFELGLSPRDGESLKNHLGRLGYSPEQLAQAGVVRKTDNGWPRDLFRGRLMIPIRNRQGELSGFGGRTLDQSNPKYINSPRSPVFDKSRLLYALYLAKEEAGSKGLVVVEGYMDAIAAHEHGFRNVVASMGTALTEHQVADIRSLTNNVTMALDADAAGQQATLRSLETSWQALQVRKAGQARGITMYRREEMPEIKIAVLPQGQDPDEVIRRSPQEWERLVEGGMPLMDYLFVALSAQVDPATPQGKARMVELLFPLIAAVPEPTQQDHYFQALADRLGVTQETLRATIGRPSAARRTRDTASQTRAATPSPFAKLDRDPVEDYCLALLLGYQELEEAVGDLRPEYFRRLENREIFNQWMRVCQGHGDEPPLAPLQDALDEELAEHLASLVQKALPPLDRSHRVAAFQDAVHRLEERYLRGLKVEERIKFTEDPPDLVEESHQEFLEVNQRLKRNQDMRGTLAQDFSQGG